MSRQRPKFPDRTWQQTAHHASATTQLLEESGTPYIHQRTILSEPQNAVHISDFGYNKARTVSRKLGDSNESQFICQMSPSVIESQARRCREKKSFRTSLSTCVEIPRPVEHTPRCSLCSSVSPALRGCDIQGSGNFSAIFYFLMSRLRRKIQALVP